MRTHLNDFVKSGRLKEVVLAGSGSGPRGYRLAYDEVIANRLLDELEQQGKLRASRRWKFDHRKSSTWSPPPIGKTRGV